MYELSFINTKLLSKLYKSIHQVLQQNNPDIKIFLAVKNAVKKLEPSLPDIYIVRSVQKSLEPFRRRLKHHVVIRDFESEEEAHDIFLKHCGEYYENLDTHSQKFQDMLNMAYDLKEYDKVLIIDGEKYLFNHYTLQQAFKQHYKAWKKWKFLERNKPAEKNINIAHNTNKRMPDKLKVFKESYQPFLNNPFAIDKLKTAEYQIINDFEKEHRILARATHYISQIKYHENDDELTEYIVKSYKNLAPYLDSDMAITEDDITNSWLTHVALVYTKLNPKDIPLHKLAKFITLIAQNSVIKYFDYDEPTPIINTDKLKNIPIRERAFFKGLRLMEFTDKRLKITKSEEEIEYTERYLTAVNANLRRFIKS